MFEILAELRNNRYLRSRACNAFINLIYNYFDWILKTKFPVSFTNLFSEPVLVNSSYALKFPPTSETYQDNSYKMWRFIVSAGTGLNVKIGYLDTEFNEDFLYIGTGLQKFNTTAGHWITMTGHKREKNKYFNSTSITMIFTSNGMKADFGFRIECSAVYSEIEGNDNRFHNKRQSWELVSKHIVDYISILKITKAFFVHSW